jgi:ATP-binding cassette subfamily F protein 3
VPPQRKRVHFSFPTCEKSGRMVFDLKGIHKAYGPTRVFGGIDLHIERGDRIALLGPNGAGKSTLIRLLSGVEDPDAGSRLLGHQVVMQYFAQDEAARLDPDVTVYETLSSGSPLHMVPMIRDILGGFLFSGDDVYKKAGVLSGGERTRLAVARMLLRPSNTLLLDEPTNHLDLDSKDVLLDALMDYGGTLVVVSHDRYFIDKLATKVIEIGDGRALLYPGTYEEFHWSKTHAGKAPALPDGLGRASLAPAPPKPASRQVQAPPSKPRPVVPKGDRVADYDAKKRADADARKRDRARKSLQDRIRELEGRIADREGQVEKLEATMSAPGFYDDREKSKPVIDRHQKLMWDVGDLMGQWEALQHHAAEQGDR